MLSKNKFPTCTTVRYLDSRTEAFDPSDPFDPVFFSALSTNMGKECAKYKNALVEKAEKLLDPDQLDYEPDHPTPLDMDLFKTAHPTFMNNCFDEVPIGGSLHEILACDVHFRTNSWSQPVIDTKYEKNFFHHSHVFLDPLLFSPSKFKTLIRGFWKNHHDYQRLVLNSNHLSFTVETVKIPKSSHELIMLAKKGKRGRGGITCDYSKGEELVEVPVCFTICDQVRDHLHFRFDLTEEECQSDTTKKFTVGQGYIPPEVVQFWKSLPLLFSDGADNSINCLTNHLQKFYDLDVQFKVFDIASLAVVAGCRLDQYDLNSLSIIAFGKPFPDWIQGMDNSWSMPQTLQCKKDNDSKLVYQHWRFNRLNDLYLVLVGHIIRTFWPDPDVVLSEFCMTQPQFIRWFCEFLGKSVVHAKVGDDDLSNMTRVQMIRSLNPTSLLLDGLSELYIPVPSLAFGGPRWLHHARHEFKHQFSVVRKLVFGRLMGQVHFKCPNVSADLILREDVILYGRKYLVDDSGSPIPEKNGIVHIDLQANPQFSEDLYTYDPLTDNLCGLAPQFERPLTASVLEWARLDVLQARMLLEMLRTLRDEDLSPFWFGHLRLYANLRNMFEHILCEAQMVESLEFLLTATKENVAQDYAETEAKLQLKLQQHRVVVLEEAANSSLPLNPGLHQKVYCQLPGDNTERNKVVREIRNAKRLKFSNEPGFETRSKTKRRKQLEKLSVRQDLAQSSGVPNSCNSLAAPVPSSSSSVSFDTQAKSFDGPKRNGKKNKYTRNWKKTSKSRFAVDLRTKLQNKAQNQ